MEAGQALGSVREAVDGARDLDLKAVFSINRNNDDLGVERIVHALAEKRNALLIAQKAAKKKISPHPSSETRDPG